MELYFIEYQLTNDIEKLKSQIGSKRAKGIGDNPEDGIGAYDQALDNIAQKWSRLIIHIADAPHMEVNGVMKIIIMKKIVNFILKFKNVLIKI